MGEGLSWDSHIDTYSIVKKSICRPLVIKRDRNLVVLLESLIMVYKALIQSYFDYCSSVWGNIDPKNYLKIQELLLYSVTLAEIIWNEGVLSN